MKNSLLALALAAATMPLTFAATTKPASTTPVKTGNAIHSSKTALTGKSHKIHKSSKSVSHRRTTKKSIVQTASAQSRTVKPK